ncbi:MAG: Gfo/Idh/MocA family oxidoreductase [Candidatus Dormiibacterota bacterium]
MRWGVLGSSRIAARAVIPAIRAAGGEVVAVGSRDRERGSRVAGELGIPSVPGGYLDVLNSNVDCVYIPLPNSLHLPLCLEALERGKHVLCEKPLALTAKEADEMGAAALRQKLVLAEALMYRYHPRWEVILRVIREGRIGVPQHVAGSFAFPLQPGDDYRWDAELGGGALYDVGSYLVSASRWVLGGEPTRVLASAGFRGGVDLWCDLLLDFPDQGGAALSCGFSRAESQWLRLEGSEATLVIPAPFTAWRGQRIPVYLERTPDRPPAALETPAADPYQVMAGRFMEAVREGSPPPTSAAEAAANLRVIDACRESWKEGAAVPVSPAGGPR